METLSLKIKTGIPRAFSGAACRPSILSPEQTIHPTRWVSNANRAVWAGCADFMKNLAEDMKLRARERQDAQVTGAQ
jgi:hypothetical protein